MIKNAYIHIPFCKSKCNYCSFVSFPILEKKKDYLTALKKEITQNYKKEILETLYFGGGTPSLLSIKEFQEILSYFNYNKDTEITAELNPETLNQDYLKGLHQIGVNRISIGCQTFDDDILKIIGRKHNAQQVKNVVQLAQNIGFKNISLDFIYGLPTQTIEKFTKDIETAKLLKIQHISLYGLKIDKGCLFAKNIPENLPDDDSQADMYLKAIEVLNDFEHYEISNFSKKNYHSCHNLSYWDNKNYYGFGCAAHGYTQNIRYSNTNDLNEYIQNPLIHKTETKLTKQEQLEEEIFLGFRKMNGINIFDINKKYGIDFEKKYSNILFKYFNYFTKTADGYALSNDGVLISNSILAEFLQ